MVYGIGSLARQGAIDVSEGQGNEVATIPIGSLESERGKHAQLASCFATAADPIREDSKAAVLAGKYTVAQPDGSSLKCDYAKGPVGKRRGRKPLQSSDGSSTVSNSARSSVGQSTFRSKVTHRDSACLLTEVIYTGCTACHIVPFSRFELYPEILGRTIKNAYEAWMGVLLRDDMHKHFDRYAFSFLPRDSDYVLHCFTEIPGVDIKLVHGKVIPFTKYNLFPTWKPHPKPLLWHYR
ncbi:MAG: hypothetical protein CYPHOPRED_002203, partial [Cyphobasidiales sp. Tagirdzhanova-0007]